MDSLRVVAKLILSKLIVKARRPALGRQMVPRSMPPARDSSNLDQVFQICSIPIRKHLLCCRVQNATKKVLQIHPKALRLIVRLVDMSIRCPSAVLKRKSFLYAFLNLSNLFSPYYIFVLSLLLFLYFCSSACKTKKKRRVRGVQVI
jgi:hypothetical protein